jgi:hypothetical protein
MMQFNMEFGYQLSISSRIEENHGRSQSGIKYANPNVTSHLAVALFEKACIFVL